MKQLSDAQSVAEDLTHAYKSRADHDRGRTVDAALKQTREVYRTALDEVRVYREGLEQQVNEARIAAERPTACGGFNEGVSEREHQQKMSALEKERKEISEKIEGAERDVELLEQEIRSMRKEFLDLDTTEREERAAMERDPIVLRLTIMRGIGIDLITDDYSNQRISSSTPTTSPPPSSRTPLPGSSLSLSAISTAETLSTSSEQLPPHSLLPLPCGLKARVQSPTHNDIHTVPIEKDKYSRYFYANYLWDLCT